MNAPLMGRNSEKELVNVHPLLVYKIRLMAATLAEAGEIVHVIQGYRSAAYQDALYAQVPKVTNARGGYSAHNFGYAVDLAPGITGEAVWTPDWKAADPLYKAMVAAGEALGLVSGSTWHDIVDWPHFQLPGLPVTPTDEMRAVLASGGLSAVWSKFIPVSVTFGGYLGT